MSLVYANRVIPSLARGGGYVMGDLGRRTQAVFVAAILTFRSFNLCDEIIDMILALYMLTGNDNKPLPMYGLCPLKTMRRWCVELPEARDLTLMGSAVLHEALPHVNGVWWPNDWDFVGPSNLVYKVLQFLAAKFRVKRYTEAGDGSWTLGNGWCTHYGWKCQVQYSGANGRRRLVVRLKYEGFNINILSDVANRNDYERFDIHECGYHVRIGTNGRTQRVYSQSHADYTRTLPVISSFTFRTVPFEMCQDALEYIEKYRLRGCKVGVNSRHLIWHKYIEANRNRAEIYKRRAAICGVPFHHIQVEEGTLPDRRISYAEALDTAVRIMGFWVSYQE